jgi:aspartate/methionine/tyrosine aminotransferase
VDRIGIRRRVLAEIARCSLGYPDPKPLEGPLKSALGLPTGVEVLPTSGAAEAVALAMHEIAESRTERDFALALPSPSYGAFKGLASLLGLKIKQYPYRPATGWRPDLEQMCALAKECSAFVVNNPHNPSGYVIPDKHIETLSQILSSRGAVLIVDEVFRFPNETRSAIELDCDIITLGSLSKTHGLPGLRLGWIAARRERLSRYRTLQQYLSLSLNSFSVAVGRSVFNGLTKFDRVGLIRANRMIVMDWAQQLRGLVATSVPSGGTTVCVTADKGISEEVLFQASLDAGVLIAPGNRCFERGVAPTWFRLGYGAKTDLLRQGLELLERVIRDQHERSFREQT